MLDFLMISTRSTKRGVVEIYPRFKICKSKDLMIRGGDFYAIWNESAGYWSTSEEDAINIIDNELDKYVREHRDQIEDHINVLYMWDADSGSIDRWHKYCQKQQRDNYHALDETLIFANQIPAKENYASKQLNYSLEEGDCKAWKELTSVLYSPEELHKIEWAIGAIVTGDSKWIQKYIVFYGPPGSGKSTIIEIIQKLFDGYYCIFDSKALGSANSSFALEPFKANPLVAIEHDGDLSKIEDNTKLNSLISHEKMIVNEKHRNLYTMKFISFLISGTNKYVKITDSKSGMIRRLIDIRPTGKKLSFSKYNALMKEIDFELGHIAAHCRDVYLENPQFYQNYKPTLMMEESNDFYNFVLDAFSVFKKNDGITLKQAYELYKVFCDDSKITNYMPKRIFKNELLNYFENYDERITINGEQLRSYFSNFKSDILKSGNVVTEVETKIEEPYKIVFKKQKSNLDIYCADCFAQYANNHDIPKKDWNSVTTKLKDLDTSKVHYLRVPENLIVIDFDIKDENGEKSFEKNLEAASKFPPTYAEKSKSGGGIHLHYIYNGDVTKISRIYAESIEIKVYTGKSSLRRKLTECNDLPINTITGGLPIKQDKKKEKIDMNNLEGVEFNRYISALIRKNLNKEIHGATKPSIDFIYKILEDAYESGKPYDVSKMKPLVIRFAAASTNQSDYCLSLVPKMHFKSADGAEDSTKILDESTKPIVIFDMEVFPNVVFLNYKILDNKMMYRLINPSANDIEKIVESYRLVGFNNRKYDNHILYAIMLGYSNLDLYKLSHNMIYHKEGFFNDAYNLSYTDIYDYSSKKQTLKKWEIQLGLHHLELGLPWDKPVEERLWPRVSEYCDNDVISTEAVWDATQGDFTAREILADLAGMSVNDTTNTLTTKIIFGNEKNPTLVYTDLSEEFPGYTFEKKFNEETRKYEKHNWYRGTDLGFGGYVYAEPGMYGHVALLDIASLHPHSIKAMNVFGEYTKNFVSLMDTRIYIKHEEYDKARQLFNGKLAKYLEDESTAKQLSKALKIAINSVYGLTSANFPNPFKDTRNENNIVALRGALFMRTLQDEVVARGFKVAHIKTDSIKIPDATPEIIDFCMKFATKYGYTFEHEATYDRICLVNDAVYIAKFSTVEQCYSLYGKKYVESSPETCKENKESGGQWTATGTQFAIPYVFKKCFSHEEITFPDLCEAKEVKSVMYLDMNENLNNPDMEYELNIREKIEDIWDKSEKQNNIDDNEWSIDSSIAKGNIVRDLDYACLDDKSRKSIDKYLNQLNPEFSTMSKKDILDKLHNYKFVGRVGLFCPIKEGKGGGLLVREQLKKDGTLGMDAVVGTKGYRWLESEEVYTSERMDDIDLTYYNVLVDNAISAISEYGDYEWFVSDDPYQSPLFLNGAPVYDKEINEMPF